MKLEFGWFDGFAERDFADGATADALADHIRTAQLAEQLGYGYYFFIEHQNAPFAVITSPSVYLAAIAQATSTLRFGPMVYQLPMYHPIRLAQDAATLDQISRGRLEFGIGYGTRTYEFEPWHLKFEERRELGNEVMDVVLKAWTEDRVTYHGEFFQFDDAVPRPKPYQQPHPPIWIGAHSNASFDYAAERNYHVGQNIDVDAVAGEKFAYWREKWKSFNHLTPMPRTLLARHVHVAETDAQARDEAEAFLVKGMRPGSNASASAIDVSARPEIERTPERVEFARVYQGTATSFDFWIENGLAVVGSPETVAARLQEQQATVGYDIFLAQHQISDMPTELAKKSLRLFGEKVIPAFA
jgi:alkanesulfonate monooxygenase SsuD/methylene tetrahydromethanopterin reductase-like flavin-dependent oxidoreductase (luciferase family)